MAQVDVRPWSVEAKEEADGWAWTVEATEVTFLVLVVIAVVQFGWNLATDGPLAYYVMHGMQGALLFGILAFMWRADLVRWAVCSIGVVCELADSVCGVAFPLLSSKDVGLCDAGTGLPVAAVIGAIVLLVAAWACR